VREVRQIAARGDLVTDRRLTPEQIAELRAYYDNLSRADEIAFASIRDYDPRPGATAMTDQTTPTKRGSGLLYGMALFLIFTGLELSHTVSWSWWLVTAPLWVPTANILTLIVIGAVVGIIRGVFKVAS
jgi:hypothetical protein